MEPLLQCVQHFRRIETVHKGDRWFDLKRFGIEIEHRIGTNRIEKLVVGDKRWAIQLPYEVWIAGLEKNERDAKPQEGQPTPNPGENVTQLRD